MPFFRSSTRALGEHMQKGEAHRRAAAAPPQPEDGAAPVGPQPGMKAAAPADLRRVASEEVAAAKSKEVEVGAAVAEVGAAVAARAEQRRVKAKAAERVEQMKREAAERRRQAEEAEADSAESRGGGAPLQPSRHSSLSSPAPRKQSLGERQGADI